MAHRYAGAMLAASASALAIAFASIVAGWALLHLLGENRPTRLGLHADGQEPSGAPPEAGVSFTL
jgi:hypothetical protein